jgi:pilus assembly protein Flp/PilA
MITFLRSFVRDEAGAATAEYAMLLAIIGSGIAVAALTLSDAVAAAVTDAGDCVASNATC